MKKAIVIVVVGAVFLVALWSFVQWLAAFLANA
jgi:hypothetical protein